MNTSNNLHRPIDQLLKKSFSVLTSQTKLVHKVKIKTWKALGMITFVAGFAAAFVWGLSARDGWHSLTISAPPENQVSNQAQVTFEDTEGGKYGPINSNVVTTNIVQSQSCVQAGGSCYANNCNNYENCSSLNGICPGNQLCCAGSCTTPVPSCVQAGGICYPKGCSNYDNCSSLTGTCPGNQSCCAGSCTALVQTCHDQTPYGQCSNSKPKHCDNGTLRDNCLVCGCPGNQICQSNGSCQAPRPDQSEPFDINLKKEGKQDDSGPILVRIYQAGTTNLVAEINSNANNQGKAQGVKFNQVIVASTYDLVIKIPSYLTKKLTNVMWPPSQELGFGEAKAGNLQDSDNVINSLDWSVMNANWGTSNTLSDINGDGIVNTLDWSLMNRNWGLSGE